MEDSEFQDTLSSLCDTCLFDWNNADALGVRDAEKNATALLGEDCAHDGWNKYFLSSFGPLSSTPMGKKLLARITVSAQRRRADIASSEGADKLKSLLEKDIGKDLITHVTWAEMTETLTQHQLEDIVAPFLAAAKQVDDVKQAIMNLPGEATSMHKPLLDKAKAYLQMLMQESPPSFGWLCAM